MIDNTHNKFRARLEKLLEGSNINFNGNNPWDIQVYNANLYERILAQGSLGFGEAYIEQWWDSEQVDELINKFFSIEVGYVFAPAYLKHVVSTYFFNQKTQHYEISNKLYGLMLDKYLVYSCGYWKNATNLDEAQTHKMDLICRKLNLQAGQKILDIGCGWGGFMKYAAEYYGVSCVGVTLSQQQSEYAKEFCRGLPIEIRLQDYREIRGTFDHIVSIGMMEHVGYKNYATFMDIVKHSLKEDGLFLLHTVGGSISQFAADPWIKKYIFSDGLLPSAKQITAAVEGKFCIEDWHNFGADYDKTLMCWFNNFDKNWPELSKDFDERFYRIWKYYLLSFAGVFRSRTNHLWQIVLSKKGIRGGYTSIR